MIVLCCLGELMNTSVSLCLFLSVKPQWVCSLAMLLKEMITVGSKWDAFAGEVDESHQQASRPDCIFCMSRQNVCQRKGPLTIPLWLECVTLDGLFIKCFIYPFAVRTTWLNITRNWRDWPEDKPLCSKFKTTIVWLKRLDFGKWTCVSLVHYCLWCHSSPAPASGLPLNLMWLHCGGCCYKRCLSHARMCH